MLNFIKALPVVACALLFHTNAQATDILIDDFSVGQDTVSDISWADSPGGGDFSQSADGGATILGGYRDIYVEEIDPGTGLVDTDSGVTAKIDTLNGRFQAELGDNVKGFVVVTYDGANTVGDGWNIEGAGGVNTSGLMGQDWTGTTGFLFEEVSNDQIAPVQLIVWTNDAMDGTYVKHILDFNTFDPNSVPNFYDAFIPIDGFSGGPINWADVGAFQAIFNLDSTGLNTVLDVDLSLARATTRIPMPEPAALSVFGAGVLMMGFVGYRRRKNQ